MKTTNCLSSLLVCSVLLTVGCARTNAPSTKPTPAVKPSAQQETPAAPLTDAIDLSGSTISNPAPNVGDAQRTAGPNVGNGNAAPPVGAAPSEVTPAAAAVPVTPEATITSDEVLKLIADLKLPMVAPFAVPKFEKKEEVRFLVGNKCTSIMNAAKKKGGIGNLASRVDKRLCNTNILRTGSPRVKVVPNKYISRETNVNYIAGASNETTEVILRADGTVAAVKTSTKTRGLFQRSSNERIEIASPNGNSLSSERNPMAEYLTFENKDGSVRYETRLKVGSRHAPSKVQKSLVVKNVKGLNLSVVEKSESDYSTVLGRVVKASVRCNILAIDKDLNTAYSETIEGRCFHH